MGFPSIKWKRVRRQDRSANPSGGHALFGPSFHSLHSTQPTRPSKRELKLKGRNHQEQKIITKIITQNCFAAACICSRFYRHIFFPPLASHFLSLSVSFLLSAPQLSTSLATSTKIVARRPRAHTSQFRHFDTNLVEETCVYISERTLERNTSWPVFRRKSHQFRKCFQSALLNRP